MKRLLLDTHTFIWALTDDPELGTFARSLLVDAGNKIYVSAASVWEAGIKSALGKWSVPLDLEEAIDAFGAKPLPISPYHAKMAANLPLHHMDPFDRLIIAQAQKADGDGHCGRKAVICCWCEVLDAAGKSGHSGVFVALF
ncbi:type II toxin-antitoxin system VapC family toxin [uncultured Cohaesibacter sp.]|uniref:type II toxin-antitoxin system VapC family toxin n=1 Tax=uncultured Cohaesibacter sp. TaxID=1002546 RepID=UPI0029C907EC|nr:type II toxin-antitoxin system VapC family toxin [uncultured Cohaesibacter sp.]